MSSHELDIDDMKDIKDMKDMKNKDNKEEQGQEQEQEQEQQNNEQEPLLINSSNKYTIFPIEYDDIWQLYLKHKKAIWFVDEVDLSSDIVHWNNLDIGVQFFLKHVLAFFAGSDGVLMENLAAKFCNEVQWAEARSFYAIQMFMENEHSIMYSRLIETYIGDAEEKLKLFNAIDTMPAVSKKTKWAEKWIQSSESFATRLVAFAIVESVFFSGSFCAIYWIKEKGIMPGLCNSNDFIARDEGLHCEMAILLYTKYVVNKISQEKLRDMMIEALDIEKEFITESLPCSLLGMNAKMMKEYLEFVANRIVKQLGHEEIFPNAKQPFAFMDRICLANSTDFFTTRNNDYQKSVCEGVKKEDDGELVFDEEF